MTRIYRPLLLLAAAAVALVAFAAYRDPALEILLAAYAFCTG